MRLDSRLQLAVIGGIGCPVRRALIEGLARPGVCGVTPIADMSIRNPVEPFDGTNLAAALTYTILSRESRVFQE